jgi:hypothetical protein
MMEAEGWMAKETVFSSIKITYGKYVCICNKISKYDKRNGYESIFV